MTAIQLHLSSKSLCQKSNIQRFKDRRIQVTIIKISKIQTFQGSTRQGFAVCLKSSAQTLGFCFKERIRYVSIQHTLSKTKIETFSCASPEKAVPRQLRSLEPHRSPADLVRKLQPLVGASRVGRWPWNKYKYKYKYKYKLKLCGEMAFER